MGATISTTYYELPIFASTDSPKWLVDWPDAMNKIDSAIHEAKTEADSNATSISTLQSSVESLSGSITSQGQSITTLTQNLTTLTGTVNTITELIGNGTPTTTDKTIIGAINELYNDIHGTGPSGVSADNVSYVNTGSGLTATNVQSAIDEIVSALPSAGAVELQSGSLTAGQTSVTLTFADQTIGATSLIDVYVEDGLNYTAIATTSTTVTLTFEAQASNVAVAVRVTN